MKSVNPTTGLAIREYRAHGPDEVAHRIERADGAFADWRDRSFADRASRMKDAAHILRRRSSELAVLMADEMGKVIKDGAAEIEKCASACDYYAEHAETLLKDEPMESDASSSFVTYRPLGVILAVMPWNFPFWQVFRFAAPHLMAGNVGLLKHASNVPGCALAIESIFEEAGFPTGVFSTLLISGEEVEHVIRHPLVRAVTLTGSTEAGRKVAACAGEYLKKIVLELGGSDPYVVLADADIVKAAELCATSRLINAGQSCIAAKRFIVVEPALKPFTEAFLTHFRKIRFGDPKSEDIDMGPMARADLRDALHTQVENSILQGAQLLLGGHIPTGSGAYYPPTVLSGVRPGMTAFDEELFGPVAAIVSAKDENDAFFLANRTVFGLGSALFTSDKDKARDYATRRIDAGQTFVNSFVRSDPRLPFGGTKESGYGRELGALGIREFVNAKTVYIA